MNDNENPLPDRAGFTEGIDYTVIPLPTPEPAAGYWRLPSTPIEDRTNPEPARTGFTEGVDYTNLPAPTGVPLAMTPPKRKGLWIAAGAAAVIVPALAVLIGIGIGSNTTTDAAQATPTPTTTYALTCGAGTSLNSTRTHCEVIPTATTPPPTTLPPPTTTTPTTTTPPTTAPAPAPVPVPVPEAVPGPDPASLLPPLAQWVLANQPEITGVLTTLDDAGPVITTIFDNSWGDSEHITLEDLQAQRDKVVAQFPNATNAIAGIDRDIAKINERDASKAECATYSDQMLDTLAGPAATDPNAPAEYTTLINYYRAGFGLCAGGEFSVAATSITRGADQMALLSAKMQATTEAM